MKILFLDSPAFAKLDMLDAFKKCNIEYQLFFHGDYKERKSNSFKLAFDHAIEGEAFDFVFSFNYSVVLSNCCQQHNIKYVAYVYDSPLVALYSYSLINPCNYVFLFDKATYYTFHNAGIKTVYYLPLAANTSRLTSMKCPEDLFPIISSDVSFVGSLYNEDHNFFERLSGISKYTQGYLDAIMMAQQNIYGSFLLEDLLTPDIINDLQKACPYEPLPDGTESSAYVYANYFLARKITSRERISILKKVSSHFNLKLFTHKKDSNLPNAHFIGPVDYYDTMPFIFKHSKINLNISLKSIHSGIPLRGMDIMGSGGFLLTNFQNDFLDFFIPNEDFVYYESEDDCLQKIAYYLSHDSERKQITSNCLSKINDAHTYVHRLKTILSLL